MSQTSAVANGDSSKVWSVRFLLFIAGLGGLLYGIDVGIIAGALPYLEATSGAHCPAALVHRGCRAVRQRILDAVCRHAFRLAWPQETDGTERHSLCSQYSADRHHERVRAVGNRPPDAGAKCRTDRHCRAALPGRVPGASTRGKGTGIFQWLLTLGIVAAAVIAMVFSMHVDSVKALGDPEQLPWLKILPGGEYSGCPCRRVSCSCSAAFSSRSRRAGCSAAAARMPLWLRCSAAEPPSRPQSNSAKWSKPGRQRKRQMAAAERANRFFIASTWSLSSWLASSWRATS